MHQIEGDAAPAHARAAKVAGRVVVLAALIGSIVAFNGAGQPATAPLSEDARAAPAASRSHERVKLVTERTVTVLDTAQDLRPVTVTTTGDNVRDVLVGQGVYLEEHDVVTPALSASVADGMTITVSRAIRDSVTETTTTAHPTRTVEDPNLPAGTQTVTQEGEDGTAVTIYSVHRTPAGHELAREAALVLTTAPVEEIITVGTQPPPPKASPTPPTSAAAPSAAAPQRGSNRALGAELAAARGWAGEQFACLEALWTKESQWDHTAENPSSGAYGVPQSLPGSKMASVAPDWRTNPATQIAWGLKYIDGRYGTPCAAWAHSQAKNWY